MPWQQLERMNKTKGCVIMMKEDRGARLPLFCAVGFWFTGQHKWALMRKRKWRKGRGLSHLRRTPHLSEEAGGLSVWTKRTGPKSGWVGCSAERVNLLSSSFFFGSKLIRSIFPFSNRIRHFLQIFKFLQTRKTTLNSKFSNLFRANIR